MGTVTPSNTSERAVPPGRNLNRERIVDVALTYIDEHGTQGLSMRNLAGVLGVEAMSLYRYVKGREDLLEAVVALLLSGVTSRLDDDLQGHWQGFLQTVAHEIRRIATDHPKAFPLVATRHPAAPWLRPPLRSIELVNTFLGTLTAHGLTDEQAVGVYRAFSSFLLGNLLLEASVRGADTSPVEEPLDEGGATVPHEDDNVELEPGSAVVRLRPLLSEDRSQEEFEISLETLLDRLDAELSQ